MRFSKSCSFVECALHSLLHILPILYCRTCGAFRPSACHASIDASLQMIHSIAIISFDFERFRPAGYFRWRPLDSTSHQEYVLSSHVPMY